jgi:hypothetical protein
MCTRHVVGRPPLTAKFAHLRSKNNVNFAHPKAVYALPAPIVNLKQKLRP